MQAAIQTLRKSYPGIVSLLEDHGISLESCRYYPPQEVLEWDCAVRRSYTSFLTIVLAPREESCALSVTLTFTTQAGHLELRDEVSVKHYTNGERSWSRFVPEYQSGYEGWRTTEFERCFPDLNPGIFLGRPTDHAQVKEVLGKMFRIYYLVT